MSRRAFGRRIGYKSVDLLFDIFRVKDIVCDYQPTPKNTALQDFLLKTEVSTLKTDSYCPSHIL